MVPGGGGNGFDCVSLEDGSDVRICVVVWRGTTVMKIRSGQTRDHEVERERAGVVAAVRLKHMRHVDVELPELGVVDWLPLLIRSIKWERALMISF
jgi:hypothetical protein